MTCKAGVFGHNPAMAGEGCDGCDAEHRRMMDKHIGPVLPGAPDAQDFQARIAREMAFDAGAAVAFGLMGMAEAIGENDSVRACPHCGVASDSRCYCDCAMCSPDFCLYWVCRTCFDAGKRFDVKFSSDDRGAADHE